MIPEVELLATGCGATCDGKNPATFRIYHSGCSTCYHYCSDDARTVASNNDGISLELRYSPRCRTAWARVGNDFYYPTVRSYYLDGRVRTSYSGFAGAYYTNMVNDANLLARAEASAGPPPGGRASTDQTGRQSDAAQEDSVPGHHRPLPTAPRAAGVILQPPARQRELLPTRRSGW